MLGIIYKTFTSCNVRLYMCIGPPENGKHKPYIKNMWTSRSFSPNEKEYIPFFYFIYSVPKKRQAEKINYNYFTWRDHHNTCMLKVSQERLNLEVKIASLQYFLKYG